ncbi:hypothetical protein FACS1894201_04880 [Bacteroidia bacterium]|nr:hypothetical protein FACS1894201_04880 [Bacteroidia bacterium]
MKEDFLHYLWRFKLWTKPLRTEDNQHITVLNPGIYNTDGGPDFLQAKLHIGNTIWAGSVEIHVSASDWIAHRHTADSAYDNVILHVVVYNDIPIIHPRSHTPIPCCCIQGMYKASQHALYEQWQANKSFVACEKEIAQLSPVKRTFLLERLCIESFERKVNEISDDLARNQYSWEETFYQYLLRSFGLKINADVFYNLAKSLKTTILLSNSDNLLLLEALLFGQANLLEQNFSDAYPNELKKHYQFLKTKYSLSSIHPTTVQFLRLRPISFPTLRLALFAQFIHQHKQLFSIVVELTDLAYLRHNFQLTASAYWDTHYLFDKASTNRPKRLGIDTQDLIIINSVLPFAFAYGRLRDNRDLCERAIQLMNELPAENNTILKAWSDCGITPHNTCEAQGLLQLKKYFCDEQKCFSCSVGIELINKIGI